tara:strand:- start:1673 stop:1909 length:237 start_codon:yes stop_codon:yes gene_type:complete
VFWNRVRQTAEGDFVQTPCPDPGRRHAKLVRRVKGVALVFLQNVPALKLPAHVLQGLNRGFRDGGALRFTNPRTKLGE